MLQRCHTAGMHIGGAELIAQAPVTFFASLGLAASVFVDANAPRRRLVDSAQQGPAASRGELLQLVNISSKLMAAESNPPRGAYARAVSARRTNSLGERLDAARFETAQYPARKEAGRCRV